MGPGLWRSGDRRAGLRARMWAAAVLIAAGLGAPAAAQTLAPFAAEWRPLGTSGGATLYYNEGRIGGSSEAALATGRSVFPARDGGALVAEWQREYNCRDGRTRLSRIASLRGDGTIAAASAVPGPWARPARGGPEARLGTIACARLSPNYVAPDPAPVPGGEPVGDEAGWGWGATATPELRALNVELNRRCRAMGGRANFIPDSLFGVDADLDGDGDDSFMYEELVVCPRSDADEDPRPVCGRGRCRQFLFVEDERGYRRVWSGTQPSISAVLGLTAGSATGQRPIRWDGARFVPTNGRQSDQGPRVQIEPDGVAGTRHFIFPVRINCRDEYCTWMKTSGPQPVAGVAGGRLQRLPLSIGLSSEYGTQYADVYDSQVSPEWLGLTSEAYVFCSRSHPAVLRPAAGGGYRYRIVDLPGAVGRDDGSARLYVAVCHPGVRAGDAAAVRRLGYRAVPAGQSEGMVREPVEIVALEPAAPARR